jgi:hypothetical protein
MYLLVYYTFHTFHTLTVPQQTASGGNTSDFSTGVRFEAQPAQLLQSTFSVVFFQSLGANAGVVLHL